MKENFIAWNFMTLQDAIDFVRYAINITIETMRFSNVNKTVGGPIDILVITPNKKINMLAYNQVYIWSSIYKKSFLIPSLIK